ncbi:hypothetical protein FRC12_008833 [Ceratobasidium sp. 428]|nr:hypothetical protein FRC09_005655 [Ceratobasidium sp. 395]KAG8791558.1 hypothetical protein FRC12_008833 [Ceratobasidium sp. 428]
MICSNFLVITALLAASNIVQASPLVTRGSDDLSQLIDELNQNGLTDFSRILGDEVNKNENDDLVQVLKKEKVTLLVPDNDAFDRSNPSLGKNPGNILAYSTIYGDLDSGFKTPNSSISRRDPNENHVQGKSNYQSPKKKGQKRWTSQFDQNQVVYFNQFVTGQRKRWDPVTYVDRPVNSAKVVKKFSVKNVIVLVVDTLLTLPGTVSDLLCKPLIPSTPDGFVKFGGALQKAGLLDTIDNGNRITIFAPTDDAFKSAGDISDDDLASILKNHFFFGGPIVYSALFPTTPEVTAASGKKVKLSFENGIPTVKCGKDQAQVLRSDQTTDNGILHVVDKVLKCD